MKIFVSVDDEGYVSCAMEQFFHNGVDLVEQDVSGMIEVDYNGDILDIHDYRLVDGSLIHDDSRKKEAEAEAAEAEEKLRKNAEFYAGAPSRVLSLENTSLDHDDAIICICDLVSDMQLNFDEALIAIYESSMGGV